jgi:hypothetical protein
MALKPFVLLAIFIGTLLCPRPVLADEDAFVQASELFEAGWKPSSKGLDAARALYDELGAQKPIDPRLTYAFALVQMRNRKYDDAKRLLDDVLAANKRDTDARHAKVWLLMVTQNYKAALVELEALVKDIASPTDADSEASAPAAVEFAGRVMGFVDGPAASLLADHVRTDHRKRLVALLPPTHRQSFEESYDAVLRQFSERDLDRQQTKANAKADEEKRQKRILDELERDRVAVQQEKANVAARAEKVEADFNRELADLESQLRPLVARQTRLEAQAAAVTREMASLHAEIARLLELADLAEDPVEAARLRAHARRLDLALGRYDVDLRAVQGELAGVAAQRIALAGRRQATIARQQAETNSIERRQVELRNADKRITSQEKRAGQPAAGNTAAVAALSAKAKAFTSYDEFPFEHQRARLLQSLRESRLSRQQTPGSAGG